MDAAHSPAPGVYESLDAMREAGLDVSSVSRESPLEARVEWFELLRRAVFADDSGLRFHALADGGRVTALLPLRHTGGFVRGVEALGNYYTPIFAPLPFGAADPEALRRLLESAAAERRAHTMRFAPMDPDAPVFEEIVRQLRAIGWKPFRFFCFGNWYLDAPGDWETYVKQRAASMREIRRRARKFNEAGGALEVITEAARADEALAAFQEVYSASWKKPEPYPEFIPGLVRLLASAGALRMGVATLAGRPIAAQLWYVTGRKASSYKVAYHEDYAAFSLGNILTAHLMRHVIERDHIEEFDFLIGDDAYKKFWTSARRERWGIVAYDPRTPIGAALTAREIAGRATKSARERVKSLLGRGGGAHGKG
jgi:CelD/BcsL family acetyltransferase involved in cellulose biosynthesis